MCCTGLVVCYCVGRVVLKATAASDQPVYIPVPPRVAIGNVNLLTVIAGGRALDEISIGLGNVYGVV